MKRAVVTTIVLMLLGVSSGAFAQQCAVQDTSPRRTIVNGYMRYVGEEVGTPGTVIHLGSLALRVKSNGLTEDLVLLNEARARRGSGERIAKRIDFDLKAPGAYQDGITQFLTIYAGQGASDVLKYKICGQEVSISVTERDGLDYWVVSSF